MVRGEGDDVYSGEEGDDVYITFLLLYYRLPCMCIIWSVIRTSYQYSVLIYTWRYNE